VSRRTYGTNAYVAATSASVTAGATSIPVDTVTDLAAPGYVTLDPFNASSREVIKFTVINGNNLEGLTRGLAGSAGGVPQAHASGAKVISAPGEQVVDDIFSDIEDLEAADTAHADDATDPHAAAGYAKSSELAAYLPLAGGTLVGALTLNADPTGVLEAATKQYVDGQDHDHATPIAAHAALASAHHTRYADSEAVTAMGVIGDANPLNHNRYTDAEADARAALQDHDHATPIAAHAALASAHHTKYTDAEARTAVLTTALHPGTAVSATQPRIIRSAAAASGTAINGSLWVQY